MQTMIETDIIFLASLFCFVSCCCFSPGVFLGIVFGFLFLSLQHKYDGRETRSTLHPTRQSGMNEEDQRKNRRETKLIYSFLEHHPFLLFLSLCLCDPSCRPK